MILSASFAAAATLFRSSVISGDPLIFPTDTIYGIGAPLSSIPANKKIYELKQRPFNMPMPVLIANFSQLEALVKPIAPEKRDWLTSLWDKERCTVIFEAVDTLPELYTLNGTVAVRLLPPGWLKDAVSLVGAVTATSVNKSGMPSLHELDDIRKAFSQVNILAGAAGGARQSKIIDITGGSPEILRD